MEQVLLGGYNNALDAAATEYNSPIGGFNWSGTAFWFYKIISSYGVIKYLRVKLAGAPGAGKHYDFTMYLNGSPTVLTVEIADAATTGNNMLHEVDVIPGDYIVLQCNPDNAPTAQVAAWTWVFEGRSEYESLILGHSYLPFAVGAVEYAQPSSPVCDPLPIQEDTFRQVCPTDGLITNFYVMMDVDPGTAPDAYRFTLRLNKATVAQSPIVTITADDTTGSDLVHNLDVTGGDILTLMCEPLNVPTAAPRVAWGFTFIADTDGESVVLGGVGRKAPDTVLTEYTNLTGYEGYDWTNVEANWLHIGQVCTIKNLYVLCSVAPGAGNSYAFTIRTGLADSLVVTTIADAATTGNSGGLSDTVLVDEYMSMQSNPDDGPNATYAMWGFVIFITPVYGQPYISRVQRISGMRGWGGIR